MSTSHIVFHLYHPWYWLLNENSKKYLKLSSIGNYYLLNPLYYQGYYDEMRIEKNNSRRLKTGIFVKSEVIILKYKDESNKEPHIKDVGKLFEKLVEIFRWKFRQVKINPKNSFFLSGYYNGFELKKVSINDGVNEDFKSLEHMNEKAISLDEIKNINKLFKNGFQIPIYENILIDAMVSLYEGDSVKTIIYSAIAMESMLSKKLDSIYMKIKSQKKNSKYRLIDFLPNNEVGVVSKDPIYDFLKKYDKFALLLHEKPLYLLGKSILLDDENLYNDALKVYTTRNKIVHMGEPDPSNANVISIDLDGARMAFNTAVKVFKWMGIERYKEDSGYNFISY